GQMAPTTLVGQKTYTTPEGRNQKTEGAPIKVCELLATLEGPSYIERVALNNPKNILRAKKAVRKAFLTQIEDDGFAFIEMLSACPTHWRMNPVEAAHWIDSDMVPVFPLGVFRDRKSEP
ncbi:MAG: hypothetical protein JXA52_05490, partial [Planctomycetes bacterium]|nr:hypothetical protein [Planctomycetota bacterium]